MTTALGAWSASSTTSLHGTPGRMLTALDARTARARQPGARTLSGRNLVLTHRRKHSVHGRAALERDMERTKRSTAPSLSRTHIPARFLHLRFAQPSIPMIFATQPPNLLKDHAVSDVYEPGSTFKLVAYSAALEEKVTTPDSKIDCQGGKIQLPGVQRMMTTKPSVLNAVHNVISTSQALWESSDVAAIKLALRMGQDTFYQYIRALRFRAAYGSSFPRKRAACLNH